jgi:hypothetical protein
MRPRPQQPKTGEEFLVLQSMLSNPAKRLQNITSTKPESVVMSLLMNELTLLVSAS